MLYEVITLKQGTILFFFFLYVISVHGQTDGYMTFSGKIINAKDSSAVRITSYNVCYTKLLRIGYGDALNIDSEFNEACYHKRGALCAPRQPQDLNHFKMSDISQFSYNFV